MLPRILVSVISGTPKGREPMNRLGFVNWHRAFGGKQCRE